MRFPWRRAEGRLQWPQAGYFLLLLNAKPPSTNDGYDIAQIGSEPYRDRNLRSLDDWRTGLDVPVTGVRSQIAAALVLTGIGQDSRLRSE